MNMSCGICSHAFDDGRKPTCSSCANAQLYVPRVQQVGALLDREKAHTHAEALFRPGNDGILAALPEDADWDAITAGVKHQSNYEHQADVAAIQDRVADIVERAELLRRQVSECQVAIAKRRQEQSQRREAIASERKALASRRVPLIEPLSKEVRRMSARVDKIHQRSMEARLYLCREVAILNGLKQRKRKSKDGKVKDRYWIGGLLIPDLRDLNSTPHEETSAAMDHICRLLGICCHYMSIRLPSEILLPHAGFPHSAILPEKTSYKGVELPFPGFPGSSHTSPAASRTIEKQQHLPRARLLHLDRPLSKLYKEDPKTFGLFIEGMALLACDIAWLCHSQGMGDISTFDDVCSIGKNLWRLFFSQQQDDKPIKHPDLKRNLSSANNLPLRQSPSKPANLQQQQPSTTSTTPHLGAFSHASAHHNLASSAGHDIFHNFTAPSATRLTDKLAKYLLDQMSGAEWEMLDEREWREDEDITNGGVPLAGDGNRLEITQSKKSPALSNAAAHEGRPGDRADATSAETAKDVGSKGWMKVRGRSGETTG